MFASRLLAKRNAQQRGANAQSGAAHAPSTSASAPVATAGALGTCLGMKRPLSPTPSSASSLGEPGVASVCADGVAAVPSGSVTEFIVDPRTRIVIGAKVAVEHPKLCVVDPKFFWASIL